MFVSPAPSLLGCGRRRRKRRSRRKRRISDGEVEEVSIGELWRWRKKTDEKNEGMKVLEEEE